MVGPQRLLILGGLCSTVFGKDLVLKAKFDPTRADTVEDAAWNCIVDFADANPDQICSGAVTKGPLQDFSDMCALGNVLMFDHLLHTYCKEAGIKKHGKYLQPKKRPCLKCLERSKATPRVTTTVININIIEASFTAPTTLALGPSGRPYATLTIPQQPTETIRAHYPKNAKKTAFRNVVKTVTATASDVAPAARNCLPAPGRGSSEYDNGQWCVGKYEQAYEQQRNEERHGEETEPLVGPRPWMKKFGHKKRKQGIPEEEKE